MTFQTPLIVGTLMRRYKRFLADVRLETGETITAHCPNPGAMLGLAAPGMRFWLEPNDDPRRKLKYGWRLVELPNGHWAGIDTMVPNRVIGEALHAQRISELADYEACLPEQKYGVGSRIDFLLKGEARPDAYVEVKNVHLMREPGLAEFPDSVTKRGAKHLEELADMARRGARAVMLFFVQRDDCERFDIARDLDPGYARAFDLARAVGVEVICYGAAISPQKIALDRRVTFTPRCRNTAMQKSV